MHNAHTSARARARARSAPIVAYSVPVLLCCRINRYARFVAFKFAATRTPIYSVSSASVHLSRSGFATDAEIHRRTHTQHYNGFVCGQLILLLLVECNKSSMNNNNFAWNLCSTSAYSECTKRASPRHQPQHRNAAMSATNERHRVCVCAIDSHILLAWLMYGHHRREVTEQCVRFACVIRGRTRAAKAARLCASLRM